jgi:23S rRNA (uracil1939-C5)-methyltransferase
MGDLSVGSRCEVLVTDLSHDGQGIGRRGETVVFVPGALPGERVVARLVRRHRRHWLSQLEAILDASDARRREPCILAAKCGGCSLQHLDPAAQVVWKQQVVVEALRRIAQLEHPVEPVLAAAEPLGYRNRAVIPLERRDDGSVRCGYYRRGSHRIVNLNHCLVLDPRIDALVEPIKADLAATDWPIDRDCHQGGGLRHLALRVGAHTGEVLISLISSHDQLPGLSDLAEHWMERWSSVVGVTLNLQPRATNVLMGPETRLLAGRNWIREQFAGQELHIATDTFFQVFTAQAERVVALLQEVLAAIPSPGLAIDAYCGIGTYSLPMAAAGWQVEGLEVNPEAVRLAVLNAERNGVGDRCRFEACEVAERLADLLPAASLLFLDPPRRGLDGAVVSAIQAQPPQQLVYLSCDPASLARDLQLLVQEGPYTLRRVQPLDFFPHTTHVEVLAVLSRTS